MIFARLQICTCSKYIGKSEDTPGVIRRHELRRTQNAMAEIKRTNQIGKTIHEKLRIRQNKRHLKQGMNSAAPGYRLYL